MNKYQEDLNEIPKDELTSAQKARYDKIELELIAVSTKMLGKTAGALFGF